MGSKVIFFLFIAKYHFMRKVTLVRIFADAANRTTKRALFLIGYYEMWCIEENRLHFK